MGIKKKRSGPMPTFQKAWQEIAKDANRTTEAIFKCKEEEGLDSLAEAGRKVREHRRNLQQY